MLDSQAQLEILDFTLREMGNQEKILSRSVTWSVANYYMANGLKVGTGWSQEAIAGVQARDNDDLFPVYYQQNNILLSIDVE